MFSFSWKNKVARKAEPNLGRLTLQRSQIAFDRLSRFRFFAGTDYAELHPDIGAMCPATHFVGYGADEHRPGANLVHIARTFGDFAHSGPCRWHAEESGVTHGPLTIGIYVSSLGNIFMREIATALGNLLRIAGHNVLEGDENGDMEARPEHSIYVAPHEFFFLGRGPLWVRDDVLASACMYCTEQVQTRWFWEALHIVLMARSVVDMSAPLAAAFAEVMPAACIFPSVGKTPPVVGPEVQTHPLLTGQRWWMDGAARDDRTARPLDLCFLGTVSPYRARFFARNADRLERYNGFVYLRTGNAKELMNAGTGEANLTDVAQYVARNARVLLNVHRDEFPYFEWHRLVYQGMANGCAVVSEPCFANPVFEPGIHYLAEEPHRLMDVLEWVLNDADGRDKAAAVAAAAAAVVYDPGREAARANTLVDLLTASGACR